VKVPALASARELVDAKQIDGSLESVLIAGAPKLNETVLFHRPSGVLMCADLLFNVTTHATFMSKVILSMTGTGGRQLAQSRMWKLGVTDRAAARASIDRLLAWPVKLVAPCHGEAVAVDRATLAATMVRIYGGPVTARGAEQGA
jgi:glyoxylase-like metal-dependent hydrolase (beta-lactamase superfamily II)